MYTQQKLVASAIDVLLPMAARRELNHRSNKSIHLTKISTLLFPYYSRDWTRRLIGRILLCLSLFLFGFLSRSIAETRTQIQIHSVSACKEDFPIDKFYHGTHLNLFDEFSLFDGYSFNIFPFLLSHLIEKCIFYRKVRTIFFDSSNELIFIELITGFCFRFNPYYCAVKSSCYLLFSNRRFFEQLLQSYIHRSENVI